MMMHHEDARLSDHQTAVECAVHLGGSGEAANPYLKLLMIWTRATLKQRWPEVEALAEALTKQGLLAGNNINNIMDEARAIPPFRRK
jgi:hypothetical protein